MNADQRINAIAHLHAVINLARSMTTEAHRVIAQLELDAPLENPIPPLVDDVADLKRRIAALERQVSNGKDAPG